MDENFDGAKGVTQWRP